jgi:hypothetical protein
MNRRQFKDADQVRMTFDFLLEYPQLAHAGERELEIDMMRALDDSEVIYFYCPTLAEPLTARLVAGLGLYTLIAVAMHRRKCGKSPRVVRVFVDEFHEIVGRSLGALLAQSRKFGLSMFLANQSTSQLETRDLSLSQVVFEGTAVKQYFTCLDEDVPIIQSLSKDKIKVLGGASKQRFSQTTTTRETIVPALERDTILDVTYTFGRSFLCVNDGSGHREPIILEQAHTHPDDSQTPLPTHSPAETKPRAKDKLLDGPERIARHVALRRLIDEKRALEAWVQTGP